MPNAQPTSNAFRLSRRNAVKMASVAGGAVAAMRSVHAQSPSTELIRIGLIGCGGRGTGALTQALSVEGSNVKVTAVADAFEKNIDRTLRAIEKMQDKDVSIRDVLPVSFYCFLQCSVERCEN